MKRSGGRLRLYFVFLVLVGLLFVLMRQYEQLQVARDANFESTRVAMLASALGVTSTPAIAASQVPISTIDLNRLEALRASIRHDIAQVENIGEIKVVDVLPLSDGISVSIDLASGRDSEEFVRELLTLIQAATPNLAQFRVSISQNIHGKNWLWEKSSGEMSFTSW